MEGLGLSELNEPASPELLPRSPEMLTGKPDNITRTSGGSCQETCQEAKQALTSGLLSEFREWCLLEMPVTLVIFGSDQMVKIIDFLKHSYCEGDSP